MESASLLHIRTQWVVKERAECALVKKIETNEEVNQNSFWPFLKTAG
jgi:hypothetical protein